MKKYISTATMLNEFIDCRTLRLSLEYHSLSKEQERALCICCYEHLREFLGDSFITDWRLDGKGIKQSDILPKLIQHLGTWKLQMCGQVVSNLVYNKKTFNAYRHWLLYEDRSTSGDEMSVSADYFEFFKETYANVKTPDEIKRATLKLFNAERKKPIAKWRKPDVSGHFYSHVHDCDHSLFFGSYELSIAIVCLGPNVVEISRDFSCFLEKMASRFPGISARVSLTPLQGSYIHTAYTEFFGGVNVRAPVSQLEKGVSPIARNYFCYLPGAEWFNIISPWQRTHIPDLSSGLQEGSCICTKEIPGGGIIVGSGRNILDTDIPEYSALKRALYDALFPGGSEVEFVHLLDVRETSPMVKPRLMWEYIPVFDREIVAQEDRLVFQHVNSATEV